MKIPTTRRYLNLAYRTRGKFLNFQINFELPITEYIAKYFCSDKTKREELKTQIIYQLKFKEKIELMKFITANYDKP
jgi:hypothetical protein